MGNSYSITNCRHKWEDELYKNLATQARADPQASGVK